VATLKQLPLTRYWLGRKAAQALLEQSLSSTGSSSGGGSSSSSSSSSGNGGSSSGGGGSSSSSSSSSSSGGGAGSRSDTPEWSASDSIGDMMAMHTLTVVPAELDDDSNVPDDTPSSDGVHDETPSSRSTVPERSHSSSSLQQDTPSSSSDEPPPETAAALPPIPWGLMADLADAGSLTSLELSAPQAAPLLLGDPAANTAAAAPAAAHGLAATLAGLRNLSVWGIETELSAVQRLVASCSSLTELHLDVGVRLPFLEGCIMPPDHSQRLAAAAAAVADSSVEWHLPHLRRLALYGGPSWLVNSWLDRVGPAKLTAVKLEHQAATGVDLARLAACSRLQELELRHVRGTGFGQGKRQAFSILLQQLTSLTKLAVLGAQLGSDGWDGEVPDEVWGLPQLRELDLNHCWAVWEVPSNISCLQHLTFLGLSRTWTRELPHQLGLWLPQLRCLVADHNVMLETVPHSLSRLTRLSVGCCDITSVSAVSDLVHLQQLQISGNEMEPPYEALSRLSSLEILSVNINRDDAAVTPTPLPCLHFLQMSGPGQELAAAELLGSGRFLSRLELSCLQQEQVESLGGIGVLPVLQDLTLHSRGHIDSPAPACAWLQQQPRLRDLFVNCFGPYYGTGAQLGPLPAGLQCLVICGLDVWEDASVEEYLVQLTGLRQLQLNSGCRRPPPLPAWVLQWVLGLEHLEMLSIAGTCRCQTGVPRAGGPSSAAAATQCVC
jgi:hypothetical protein